MTVYGTHWDVLQRALQEFGITSALEFGMGIYSTPLLVRYCERVVAIEMQDEEWYKKVEKTVQSPKLTLKLMIGPTVACEWFEAQNERFDLVFVDGHLDTRWRVVNAAFSKADIVVAHDTDSIAYGWDKVKLPGDWIWLDFRKYVPWTSVMVQKGEAAKRLRSWA
jgi:hypothetical protein